MNTTIIIFIGLSFGVMFLFFYMFVRDKEIEKKFNYINSSLEDIHKEIYKIQQQQKQDKMIDIRQIVSDEMSLAIEDLLQTLQNYQSQTKQEIETLVDRLLKVEANVKTISLPKFDEVKKDNTEQIKELYEMGLSAEDIAKEIGLSVSEVRFVLNTMKFSLK